MNAMTASRSQSVNATTASTAILWASIELTSALQVTPAETG
jgi:hypothetical protein